MTRREKTVKLHECILNKRYAERLADDLKRWQAFEKKCGKVKNLAELQEQIKQAAEAAVCQYRYVLDMIQGLEDARHREILHRRFLQKQSFNKIALDMSYSVDRIFQLYRQALDMIEIKKEPPN